MEQNVAGQSMDDKKWSKIMTILGYVSTIVITVADGVMIAFGYRAVADGGWGWPPAILVPAVGIVTLLGVLAISSFFQGDKDLRNGQIRAAIAASMLAVYFFVLALVMFTDSSDKLLPVQNTKDPAVASASGTEQVSEENTSETSSAESTTPQKSGVASVMDSFTDLVKVVLLGYFTVRGATEVTGRITDAVSTAKAAQAGTATSQPAGTVAQETNVTPPKPDRSQFMQN